MAAIITPEQQVMIDQRANDVFNTRLSSLKTEMEEIAKAAATAAASAAAAAGADTGTETLLTDR